MIHDLPPECPTRFPALNRVLAELVEDVHAILADDLVGFYLQGSFAVGDADMQSDCDFLAVTTAQVTAEQEASLRALHNALPTRDGYWNRRLEGSYAPSADLKIQGLGRAWLYIDNGWRDMQWSTHCNTEVMRWTLRERGVTLLGPDPATLVPSVPPETLRASVFTLLDSFIPNLLAWASEVAWERYAVATLCRILYTIETAEVASKRSSMLWAAEALDSHWRDMIRAVANDRDLGWARVQPSRPSAEEVSEFTAYVSEQARERMASSHETATDAADNATGGTGGAADGSTGSGSAPE